MFLVTTDNCIKCEETKVNLKGIGIKPETKNFKNLDRTQRSKVRDYLNANGATLPVLVAGGALVHGLGNILNTFMSSMV